MFVISGIVLIVAVIVAVVLTVPIGHTLELKRQQGVVLAKVNQQRKQMMEISQDLSREKLVSDALLFQIFPATVIETLRKGEPVEVGKQLKIQYNLLYLHVYLTFPACHVPFGYPPLHGCGK